MNEQRFPRLASLKTAEALRRHLAESQIPLEFDDVLSPAGESPLAQPITVDGVSLGNRFCILPMEGWDGTADGRPGELTVRRWRNFGRGGAKLVWGGEAVAVCHEGRANPRQLLLTGSTQQAIADLRASLVDEHRSRFGPSAADDLFVGLQLTHSGRFARPDGPPAPLIAYRHPWLDARFAAGVTVLSDDDLNRLVDTFVRAGRMAHDIGFQFVDIKHCHGYLLHELLSARERDGRYGGSIENRARFLREVIEGLRVEAPSLAVGVRVSVFDTVPYHSGVAGRGEPERLVDGYPQAFGLLQDSMTATLKEARSLLTMLESCGVRWICITAGSPYYCPHIQRPAAFPPSDGYGPPEDPLRGVARQIDATARLKAAFPRLVFVGSAYSYLQEWLPHVAQYNVRNGLTDFVGLGRAALSYPDLPVDVLSRRTLRRKAICRTFSDCTTAPRGGLVSGCYPLDPFYAAHPHAIPLREIKSRARPGAAPGT